MDAVLRARAKKHCRAVHVIKRGVAHRLGAFWVRLKFQCFVRKFATEHFEFDLVQCAIFAYSSHPFLANSLTGCNNRFSKKPATSPRCGPSFSQAGIRDHLFLVLSVACRLLMLDLGPTRSRS